MVSVYCKKRGPGVEQCYVLLLWIWQYQKFIRNYLQIQHSSSPVERAKSPTSLLILNLPPQLRQRLVPPIKMILQPINLISHSLDIFP